MFNYRPKRTVFDFFFKDNGDFRWFVIIPLIIVFLIISVFVADYIYGDWKCAFAECRIIKGEIDGS